MKLTEKSVKLIRNRVLVERLDEPERSPGGIIIPETAKGVPLRARVLAVGPGDYEGGRVVPVDAAPGDIVLIPVFAGAEVEVGGKKYVVLREDEIVAKIDPVEAA